MNKSNFWNLMFGIGMVLGGFITLKFGKAYPTPAFICAWTTLIGVPLTVRYFSKVTFTDGKFLTIEGRELDIPKQLPNGFLLIATTINWTEPIPMFYYLKKIETLFISSSNS